MTRQLLGQCPQLKRGDIFDYLGWPRDILALRLPSDENRTTLKDVIFPSLLVKMARVINKTREDAMRTNATTNDASKGRILMWMLVLLTGVMLVVWLGNPYSWTLEDIAGIASQPFARIQVFVNPLLAEIHAYYDHMYTEMTKSTEERSFEETKSG